MIIYSIPVTREGNIQYFTSKASAEWHLTNDTFIDPSIHFITEIEV